MKNDKSIIRLMYTRCLVASMLALLGGAVGQIAITVIIGRLHGTDELAVIGITLPIYYIYATVGSLLGVGGTTVCARLIGSNRFKQTQEAFAAIYLLTLIFSVVITIIILAFSETIARFLGITPDMGIFPQVKEYLRILSIGGIFIAGIYPAFNLLRLDGRNTATILIFFAMSAVTVSLAYVLVVFHGMKTAGAAIAIVSGSGVAGILGMILLFFKSKNFEFTVPSFKDLRCLCRHTIDIIIAGSPGALENLCILIRAIVINRIIVTVIGDIAQLSAFKIIDTITAFALIFIAGASGSLMPFISVFNTEKDTNSIQQILRLGFKWGCTMTAFFSIICFVFAKQTADLFGAGAGSDAIFAIRIFTISLFLAVINSILVCVYQATQNALPANILTLGRSLIWFVLSAYLFTPHFGASGIWHSFWISELIALICAIIYSMVVVRKNKYRSMLFLLDTKAEKNGTYIAFSSESSVSSITTSAQEINDFCVSNKLNSEQAMIISLAVEEMLMLIREHCFKNDNNFTMNVRLLLYEGEIILRIHNCGKEFNPVEYYKQYSTQLDDDFLDFEDSEMLTDYLGIKMILNLAKKVDYRNTFGINNVMVII